MLNTCVHKHIACRSAKAALGRKAYAGVPLPRVSFGIPFNQTFEAPSVPLWEVECMSAWQYCSTAFQEELGPYQNVQRPKTPQNPPRMLSERDLAAALAHLHTFPLRANPHASFWAELDSRCRWTFNLRNVHAIQKPDTRRHNKSRTAIAG
jgi:hypothetical protein